MLHDICGKPLCLWTIKNALKISDELIVVLGFQSEKIKQCIEREFPKKVKFAIQEKQDGTGGAIKSAIASISKSCSRVMVLCGDSPLVKTKSLKRLLKASETSEISVLSSVTLNPSGYGRIIRGENKEVIKIVEEKDATFFEKKVNEINSGIYAINFDFLKSNLMHLNKNNAKKEYYLPDLVAIAASRSEKQNPISVTHVNLNEIIGANTRVQLSNIARIINMKILKKWTSRGVIIVDPNTTFIDVEARLGKNVMIFPQVRISGKCQIFENVKIETGSIITDVKIEKSSHIFPYSVIEKTKIGIGSKIGPFARIRAGTIIGQSSKIGNFVEIKKSIIGSHSKASHLSYIGDSEIGENCNIGAGSITCNYDGINKNKTIIENNVFIGSNVTLIPPLKICENSYIGAGSTINKNIPENTLAIARTQQITMKDKKNK